MQRFMTVHKKFDQPIIFETQSHSKSAIIWLHGLGADGYDFTSIPEQFSISKTAAIRFIFPHAPERAVTINQGFIMRAWYDIFGLDRQSDQDIEGIREAEALLNRLIDDQIQSGIESSKIILAGFSQGGALALHAGLRYPKRLGGIIGLSTYLPVADLLEKERHPANKMTPIFLAHGDEDEVLPLSFGLEIKQNLECYHYKVMWHLYKMGHTISIQEIRDIDGWLKDILV